MGGDGMGTENGGSSANEAVGGGFNDARYGHSTFASDALAGNTRIRTSLEMTGEGRGRRLLDVGCFDGFVAELFTRRGWRVTGVDASPGAVAIAKTRCEEAVVSEIGRGPLPFPDASMDAVFAGEVLEHLFYTEDFLEEMRRLLKPGGFLVLSTPNLANWANRICLLFGWQPFFTEIGARPSQAGNPLRGVTEPAGHIRVFTASSLLHLLRTTGWTDLRLSGADLMQKRGVAAVDRFLSRRFPTLASDLIVKARKPG